MVKIPGLDDLKKMGSDLMDSAKTGKLGGIVVDKFKTGMESVGIKKGAVDLSGDDPLGKLLQEINATLGELTAVQSQQASLTRKLQSQFANAASMAALYQKPAVEPAPPEQPEDEKK